MSSVRRAVVAVKPAEDWRPVVEAAGSDGVTFVIENLGEDPAFYRVRKRQNDDQDWQEHQFGGGCGQDQGDSAASVFQLAPGQTALFRVVPTGYRYLLETKTGAVISPLLLVSVTASSVVKVGSVEVPVNSNELVELRNNLRSGSAFIIYLSGLSTEWSDAGATEASFGDEIATAENLAIGGTDIIQTTSGNRPKHLGSGIFADDSDDFMSVPFEVLDGNFLLILRLSLFAGSSGELLNIDDQVIVRVDPPTITVTVNGGETVESQTINDSAVLTLLRQGDDLVLRLNGEVVGTYDASALEFGPPAELHLFSPGGDSPRGVMSAIYAGLDPERVADIETYFINFPD